VAANNDAKDNRLSVVACGCLLLPVASCFFLLSPVLVLLFAVSGTPVDGRAMEAPTSAPVMPSLTQSPTQGAGRAAGDAALTPSHDTLPPSADAAKGKQLFNTFQPVAGIACSTCHRVDSEERLVGPGLLNVGIRAATRVKGQSAVTYLRDSIVNPSVYVVEGYAGIMPKTWGKVFTEAEIDDIISYLLTLKAAPR
jgi:mono/diheme cytochrome c family protein